MALPVEISIPSAQLSNDPKPHTIYNISLRLPLRSFTLQKRYSDFLSLHRALTAEASTTPPASPPPKSFFSSTLHNPALTETRRHGLETYLQTINTNPDPRWRDTSAWRTFLNLPSNLSTKSSVASTLHSTLSTSSSTPAITDPVIWLDTHRDLKSLLHDARLALTRREAAPSPQAAHEASAQAKKCLVRAGTLITALSQGLTQKQDDWGSEKLGEGEVRRRKDLVASARKERDSLENLLSTMAQKAHIDAVVADKSSLLQSKTGGKMGGVAAGRVLGRETAQTRELDNSGVLGLQKHMMAEQDEDLEVLLQAVRSQRDLGQRINEELEQQNTMLGMLDEDVTRVSGKVDVVRKRVDKIS